MTIYLIDGKPHRLCDCDEHTELCPRGVKRALQTCGFSRCFIPTPDAIYTVSGDEQTDTEYQNTYSVDDHRQALAGKQTPEWATKGTQYPAPRHWANQEATVAPSAAPDPALPGLELAAKLLEADGWKSPPKILRAEIAKRTK